MCSEFPSAIWSEPSKSVVLGSWHWSLQNVSLIAFGERQISHVCGLRIVSWSWIQDQRRLFPCKPLASSKPVWVTRFEREANRENSTHAQFPKRCMRVKLDHIPSLGKSTKISENTLPVYIYIVLYKRIYIYIMCVIRYWCSFSELTCQNRVLKRWLSSCGHRGCSTLLGGRRHVSVPKHPQQNVR